MKLHGSYTSPFVRHCRVALAQENMQYDFVEADYAASAKGSPTAKVPFMSDAANGDLMLTDSGAIVKYIREKAGNTFLADINDFETYMMATTTLDSAINLFLIENEGFGAAQIKYMARQANRVTSSLAALNRRIDPAAGIAADGALRCACLLAWGAYRKRFSFDAHANLCALLDAANRDKIFAATAPPAQ